MWTRLFSRNQNNYELPDEIWGVIFENLEPSFLVQAMRACKRFYKIADTSSYYTQINRYLPWKYINLTSIAYYKLAYNFPTNKFSKQGMKFLELCVYQDYEQIKKFDLDPDLLFETNRYGQHLVQQACFNNEKLCRVVFDKVYEWYANKYTEEYLTWLDFALYPIYCLEDWFNTPEFARTQQRKNIFHITTQNRNYLLSFAAALGQAEFIYEHQRDGYWMYSHAPLTIAYAFNRTAVLIAIALSPDNDYELGRIIFNCHQATISSQVKNPINQLIEKTFKKTPEALTLALQNRLRVLAEILDASGDCRLIWAVGLDRRKILLKLLTYTFDNDASNEKFILLLKYFPDVLDYLPQLHYRYPQYRHRVEDIMVEYGATKRPVLL